MKSLLLALLPAAILAGAVVGAGRGAATRPRRRSPLPPIPRRFPPHTAPSPGRRRAAGLMRLISELPLRRDTRLSYSTTYNAHYVNQASSELFLMPQVFRHDDEQYAAEPQSAFENHLL